MYEIEIKSLLGTLARAEEVKQKLHGELGGLELKNTTSQLNHYFEGNPEGLLSQLKSRLSDEQTSELEQLLSLAQSLSVRTRLTNNDEVRFVVKASLDEGTSDHAVARREFDQRLEGISLEELDALLLAAGLRYQAKWSRDREEYAAGDLSICFDKNAGYGHLAEFEKVVTDESAIAASRQELIDLMARVGVEELPQERIERMFAHYNKHWPEYYGTDNIFVIE